MPGRERGHLLHKQAFSAYSAVRLVGIIGIQESARVVNTISADGVIPGIFQKFINIFFQIGQFQEPSRLGFFAQIAREYIFFCKACGLAIDVVRCVTGNRRALFVEREKIQIQKQCKLLGGGILREALEFFFAAELALRVTAFQKPLRVSAVQHAVITHKNIVHAFCFHLPQKFECFFVIGQHFCVVGVLFRGRCFYCQEERQIVRIRYHFRRQKSASYQKFAAGGRHAGIACIFIRKETVANAEFAGIGRADILFYFPLVAAVSGVCHAERRADAVISAVALPAGFGNRRNFSAGFHKRHKSARAGFHTVSRNDRRHGRNRIAGSFFAERRVFTVSHKGFRRIVALVIPRRHFHSAAAVGNKHIITRRTGNGSAEEI